MMKRISFAIALIAITILMLPLAAGAAIKTDRDVPYISGGGEKHTLDIYTPSTKGRKSPALIFIHGGGWRRGDKRRSRKHGEFYAGKGIAFISVNYRLTPPDKHPAHVQDCAAAVSWVFRNAERYGVDSRRIYLSGHSAGAHLAALLATNEGFLAKHGLEPSDLKGVIPVDTASYDLNDIGGLAFERKLLKSIIEAAFGSDWTVREEASPLPLVQQRKGSYPAFLILVSGKREHAVKQSYALAKALKVKGGQSSVRVFKQHNHRKMNKMMSDADDPVAQAVLRFIQ